MLILIPLLFGISAAGLAYVGLKALRAGGEAYSDAYSSEAARAFEDMFLFIPRKRIAEAGWAAGGGAFLLVFFTIGGVTSWRGLPAAFILAALAGGLAMLSPKMVIEILRQRRLRMFNNQLVDTLVNMSNALKAGFSISQAIEAVVDEGENPIAQEFALFLQQTRVGVTFSDALENLDKRVGSQDLSLVVQAIEAARKTGGNLTEVFEKISATIRERMRIEDRIRTLTAQGRLQGLVVSVMPVIIGIAMMIVDPEMAGPFFRSGAGLFVGLVAASLIGLGALVIRKIVNIDI